jgi:hypothetical protein
VLALCELAESVCILESVCMSRMQGPQEDQAAESSSAGASSQRSSLDGSLDSHKENDQHLGTTHGSGAAARGGAGESRIPQRTAGVPDLQFTNSPHVHAGPANGAASPAVHDYGSRYDALFTAGPHNNCVPDTDRSHRWSVRWSFRSPARAADQKQAGLATKVEPCVTPRTWKERPASARKSSVHVTLPSPAHMDTPGTPRFFAPSPVHVLSSAPGPDAHAGTPQASPTCRAEPQVSPAQSSGRPTHPPLSPHRHVPQPGGIQIRTPFAQAINTLKKTLPASIAEEHCVEEPVFQHWPPRHKQNWQDVLDAAFEVPRLCIEACMCVLAAARNAVVPEETKVLLVLASAWISVCLWYAPFHVSGAM